MHTFVFSMTKKDPLEIIREISQKISKLEIRGATKITIEALKALREFVKYAPKENFHELFKDAINMLLKSRPTEPAMQNGIKYVLYTYNNLAKKNASIDEIKEAIEITSMKYISMIKHAIEKIVEIGWKRIPDDGTIMTHCHSSTVVRILIEAKQRGKSFVVISSETRPMYQGRITSRELAKSGIRVYHIVDSAMRWAARHFKPDLALVGADAITSTGVIINKVGSRLLALTAKEFDIPLYVAATLLKLDPRTAFGEYTPIEMRDPSEVWPDAPENVIVLNPAFETVSPEYIDGIITEFGIIPPSEVLRAFKELYKEIWQISKEYRI